MTVLSHIAGHLSWDALAVTALIMVGAAVLAVWLVGRTGFGHDCYSRDRGFAELAALVDGLEAGWDAEAERLAKDYTRAGACDRDGCPDHPAPWPADPPRPLRGSLRRGFRGDR